MKKRRQMLSRARVHTCTRDFVKDTRPYLLFKIVCFHFCYKFSDNNSKANMLVDSMRDHLDSREPRIVYVKILLI